MTLSFTGRVPTLWHGLGIAGPTVSRLTSGRDTLVIADGVVVLSSLPGFAARVMKVDAQAMDARGVAVIAKEIARRPPDVIVAVGGGSVLDASKLAALVLADGRVLEYVLGHAKTSALTVLPDVPPPVDLVAVPTTIGTSSETNSVAILRSENGYRLIVGRALRPRHAIIDGTNLSTLTPTVVAEGVLEAFLRLAGASASPRRSGRARRDAHTLGNALLAAAARDANSATGRLRLARLSAATQRSGALRGEDPYSARHWYLANEVAFRLSVRKMIATAAVVPAVWRRICADDTRWGDRESLERFWTQVDRRGRGGSAAGARRRDRCAHRALGGSSADEADRA